MSMQTANHTAVPAPYPHSAYPSTMDEKAVVPAAHHGMVPGAAQTTAEAIQAHNGTRGNYEFS